MLTSPGVEVKIVNESFYSPAAPGTVPAIFLASASNKINASGTSVATGTMKQNAERPMLVSSQRELAELFGDPMFYTDSNNTPVHGNELNEYGLQAAYSYLGTNNRAWILRADLDLSELVPSTSQPTGDPRPGTYWLDTKSSEWGMFQWDQTNQRFEHKNLITVHESSEIASGTMNENGTAGYVPKRSVGQVGSYAIVFASTISRIFYRNNQGVWVLVGSKQWKSSFPTISSTISNPTFSGTMATMSINGVDVVVTSTDNVSSVSGAINSMNIPGVTSGVVNNRLEIYSDGTCNTEGEIELGGDLTLMDELGIYIGDSSGSKTFHCPALHIDKHTRVPEYKRRDSKPRPTGSAWVKTTQLGGGAKWNMRLWNEDTEMWDEVPTPIFRSNEQAIYEMDRGTGGSSISAGSVFVQYNVAHDESTLATFKIFKREPETETVINGLPITNTSMTPGSFTLKISSTDIGSPNFSNEIEVPFTVTGSKFDSEFIAGAIAGANIPNVVSSVNADNGVQIKHTLGGEIRIVDDEISPILHKIGFSSYVNINNGTPNLYYKPGTDGDTTPMVLQASLWKSTINMGTSSVSFYVPGEKAATFTPDNDQLWYHSTIDEVDIMIHNGDTWVGYHNYNDAYKNCDPKGPIVAASMPFEQSDGTSLVDGDLWIDTSDIDNYPLIYRFNEDLAIGFDSGVATASNIANGWELLDTTDQTTENGVLFADARYNTSGENSQHPAPIDELLENDYLDPDAPDPVLYPRGMLLWNTRRSGFNVKRYVWNYIDTLDQNTRYYYEPTNSYYPHRWVTESSNQEDGRGSFGRIAQRRVVVQALQKMINRNEDIRDVESKVFNLMATPGYPELNNEMISLNYDRRLSSFIVADSPARLNPSTTSINEWASNVNGAAEDNDNGLVSRDEYLGVYYPWGYTSDNMGNNVVVPPSHMMLSTIARSDQIAYPWFAPAGVRRGGITNASSVGYINKEGEYQTVALNEGQRDTLYEQNVNPISYMSGTGLVAYGQKTRSRGTSAMDRVNVSRLVIYLRRQLEIATRPFIFQPNDELTRQEVSNVVNGIMISLMSQRALGDYLVVCDESNNTRTRIDRNELWIDVAIEPIRAVEFIYIPLRIKNTGGI